MIESAEERTGATSTPVIASVSHLLLEVTDLDRSLDFYVGVLGFRVRERSTMP